MTTETRELIHHHTHVTSTVTVSVEPTTAYGRTVMRALELGGPSTPRELARSTGVSELIIGSVLQALSAVDCLDYRRSDGRYSLWCDLPRQ